MSCLLSSLLPLYPRKSHHTHASFARWKRYNTKLARNNPVRPTRISDGTRLFRRFHHRLLSGLPCGPATHRHPSTADPRRPSESAPSFARVQLHREQKSPRYHALALAPGWHRRAGLAGGGITVVGRRGGNELRGMFYMLRSREGSENLADHIDLLAFPSHMRSSRTTIYNSLLFAYIVAFTLAIPYLHRLFISLSII